MSAATAFMRLESIALDLANAALASSLPTTEGLARLAAHVQLFDQAALAPGSDMATLRAPIALSLLAREFLDQFDDLTLAALRATAALVTEEFSW